MERSVKIGADVKAIVMNQPGEADVLSLAERPISVPGPREVLVEVSAAGINFMDVGVRRGTIWTDMPNPKPLGVEGAGRVLAVGSLVETLSPGQRVAWVYVPGSYAEQVIAPASALVPIPDQIDDHTAAAVMMQGLTASHFATAFYPVQPGDVALVHAAAGGVGLLLTQIIKHRGGRVIGRVSSIDKVAVAKAAGADEVIIDTDGQFAADVLRLTDGRGLDVVFDGSGPKTFQGSLDSLRRCGTFCWYGPVLGGRTPIEIMSLPKSIKLGYATFTDSIYTPELLKTRTEELFDWIIAGQLKVRIGHEYPLAKAAEAHAAMESRATTGKSLLIPASRC
jgi:NADPH2:quinone reductase